jgi:phosphoribosylaminoimidazole-succinocarboxamide synthase
MNAEPLLYTDFKDLKLFRRGKVRDVYEAGENLLIVSTDRISAFDVVLSSGIPDKGKVLNQLSIFWFDFTRDLIANHFLTADINKYPKNLQKYKDSLSGRSMLVKKTKPIAFECVVRGYLSGSAYKEYQKNTAVCGIKLPPGLKESDKLTQPIFTPATKEEVGHDLNVTSVYMQEKIGKSVSEFIKETSLKIYKKCADYAERKGIIIADTKFEFGFGGNEIILIDEILTPDSSRFWPKRAYSPGGPQVSYDKQFVRDYLEKINWSKTPPVPNLPKDVIEKTADKYRQALKTLAGISL